MLYFLQLILTFKLRRRGMASKEQATTTGDGQQVYIASQIATIFEGDKFVMQFKLHFLQRQMTLINSESHIILL